jgi:hypothetical protein
MSWINDNWGFLLEDFNSGHITKGRLAEKKRNSAIPYIRIRIKIDSLILFSTRIVLDWDSREWTRHSWTPAHHY